MARPSAVVTGLTPAYGAGECAKQKGPARPMDRPGAGVTGLTPAYHLHEPTC